MVVVAPKTRYIKRDLKKDFKLQEGLQEGLQGVSTRRRSAYKRRI